MTDLRIMDGEHVRRLEQVASCALVVTETAMMWEEEMYPKLRPSMSALGNAMHELAAYEREQASKCSRPLDVQHLVEAFNENKERARELLKTLRHGTKGPGDNPSLGGGR